MPFKRIIAIAWIFIACGHVTFARRPPDIKTLLEEALGIFLKKKDFKFQSFNVSGSTAEGTVEFFDRPASFVLEYSDESHFKTLSFKLNSPLQFDRADSKRLTGENLDRWWPNGLVEPGATAVVFEFNNSLAVSSLKVTMPGGNWSPVKGSSLQVNNTNFIVTVNEPAAKRPSLSIAFTGDLNMGGVMAAVNTVISSSGQDWSFSGKVPTLVLGQVLRSAINDPILNELPSEINALSLKDIDFSVQPLAEKFTAGGTTDLGRVEFEIKPGPEKALSLLMGFRPPTGFQLSRIAAGLRPLDNMGLQNTVFVLSSAVQPSSLQILQGVDQARRGLTMIGTYDLTGLSKEFATWIGQTQLNVESTVSNNMSDVMLAAYVRTDVPFDASGNVTMREIRLSIRPAPALKVDMAAFIDIKTSDNVILRFKSTVAVDIPNLAIGIAGTLDGVWNNPFGISQGLTVQDLGLGISASFKGGAVPLPALALRGNIIAGSGNPPEFSGGLVVGLNTYDPINSMVDAHFDKLNLGQVARAFAGGAAIPADLTNTLANATLSDVQLTVVPNPNGVRILDKDYQSGFLVKGALKIQDFDLNLLVRIEQGGLEARGAMDAIRHEPFFALTSADGVTGPAFDISVKPSNVRMALTGAATVLGISRSAEMYIRDSGFELMTSGKILNVFNGTLRVYGSSVKDGGTFGVNVKLENDLWQYINENATKEIDRATKDTQNGINGAKNTITTEQNNMNSLDTQIDQQRRIVQGERDRDCQRLRNAEADVEAKRQSVESIQNDINNQHATIAAIDRRISAKNAWVDAAPNFIEKGIRGTESTGFYIEQAALRSGAMAEIAAFETVKATANATMIAAREIVGGMAYLCNVTPIDADPRVAALIGSKETAKGSMEAAKQVLEGAKIVTVGTFTAGKWIVENGSPAGVIVISSAEFDGNLSMVNGGKVSLKIKGTFAGNPLDTSFAFDFQNPMETVTAFANSLVR